MNTQKSYTQLLQEKYLEYQRGLETHFLAEAYKRKPDILEAIKDTVPLFWSVYQEELEAGQPGWFNSSDKEDPLYGMSGIIVWNHLVFGLQEDKLHLRIFWPKSETFSSRADCKPLTIGKVRSKRQALENEFLLLEGLQKLRHLIRCAACDEEILKEYPRLRDIPDWDLQHVPR